MAATTTLAQRVGVQAACSALVVPRATYYRHLNPRPPAVCERPRPPLALTPEQRQQVLEVLYAPRFVDLVPRQIWATLLDDEQLHLCSVRTMYRFLAAEGEVRERRNQARRGVFKKPELVASAPNQVWTWDITKLKGPVKWSYFYLFVILDLYSRLTAGWMVARRESVALAERIIVETLGKQGVGRDQVTLHADRGPSQTAKSLTVTSSRNEPPSCAKPSRPTRSASRVDRPLQASCCQRYGSTRRHRRPTLTQVRERS